MDLEIFVILITVLSYGALVAYYSQSRKIRKLRQNEKSKEFFKVLMSGLKSETISTLDDVINLHIGIIKNITEKTYNKSLLSKTLREFLVLLTSKNKEYLDNNTNNEKILEWKEKITEFIKKNDEESPYSDLPPIEKSIFEDLLAFSENKDSRSITRKISELSNMIKIRNDELKKSQSRNNTSITLATLGAILTVIFGIIAVTK